MEYTRREILLGAFKPLRRVAGSDWKAPSEPASEPGEAAWVGIGFVADFPFGKRIVVNDGRQVVVSLSEGLRAVDANEAAPVIRPLRLAPDGALSLDPAGRWPAGSVLNLMTGNHCLAQED